MCVQPFPDLVDPVARLAGEQLGERVTVEVVALVDIPVDRAIERLTSMGNTFEKDGALWLATEKYGDDKDRVIVRSDGTPAYKQFPGMEGALYYYFGIPKNPINEAMVARHYKEFKAPPDFFTAGGFSAAMAVVTVFNNFKGYT